jgi:hypothetical protein
MWVTHGNIKTIMQDSGRDHEIRGNVEISALRQQPFIPDELIVYGLLYELATGHLEVVVNGYDKP